MRKTKDQGLGLGLLAVFALIGVADTASSALLPPQMSWVSFGINVIGFVFAGWLVMRIRADLARRERMERELKNTLSALHDSETRFRALAEATVEGVCIHEKGLILACNPSFATHFGYELSEMIGVSVSDLVIPTEVVSVFSKIENEVEASYETTGLKKDGSRFPIEVNARSCVYLGRPARMAAVKDITEQKATEELLERQNKRILYSAKMTALGEMAAGLAHEINNPLTVISVQAQCLQLMVDSGKVERSTLGSAVNKIDQTVDRIARIVRGLRSFARDGSHDPFESVSVQRLITDTVEFCKARFLNNKVDLRIKEVAADFKIEARQVQISEILLNLLNNAFDAVERLAESWVEVSVAIDGEWWELRVRDSGRGVSEEYRDRIMQPFFTTKSIGKGTGLGLSLSRGIAESHGGRLSLNRASERTEFVLRLPIRQASLKKEDAA